MKDNKERFVKIAKLLAEENINVTFDNIKTAYFDLESRHLALPIFRKELLNDDVYGMMVAHEVGHALYTPEKEWKDFINNQTSHKSVYKSYANVVEDARIERFIKKRFPGIVRDMNLGYNAIHERNFFGLKENENLSERSLVDRINLHFKSYGNLNVPFTEDEMYWVNRVASTETFDDVINLSKELFDYEQNKLDDNEDQSSDESQEEQQSEQGSSDEQEEQQSEQGSSDEQEQQQQQSEQSSSDEQEVEESTNEKSSENVNDEDSIVSNSSEEKTENIQKSSDTPKEVESDTAMSENLESSTENIVRSYNGILHFNTSWIEKNWQSYVVSNRTFHDHIRTMYENMNDSEITNINIIANKKLKSVIQKYVQEFERKHTARTLKRTRESRTGRIDNNKLSTYRWNDNIFLNTEITEKGKNHSLFMMIDLSGSMSNKIKDTFSQIYIMTRFAQKVGIPFKVVGFTDSGYITNMLEKSTINLTQNIPNSQIYSQNNFCVVEILDSSAPKKNTEFILSAIASSCFHEVKTSNYYSPVIWQNMLSMTPLNSALLIAPEMIQSFNRLTQSEKTTFILYTDGGASDSLVLKKQNGERDSFYRYNRFIDVKTQKYYDYTNDLSIFNYETSFLLERIKNLSGVRVLGFFIQDSRKINQFKDSVYRIISITKKEPINTKIEGLVTFSNVSGYDYFTMVHYSLLSVENVTMESQYNGRKTLSEATKKTIENTYIKTNNKRNSSKFLVKDVIEAIA